MFWSKQEHHAQSLTKHASFPFNFVKNDPHRDDGDDGHVLCLVGGR